MRVPFDVSDWGDLALRLLAIRLRGQTLSPREAGSLLAEAQPHTLALRSLRIEGLLHLACGASPVVQRVYDRVWAAQRRGLVALLESCAASGVQPLVVKGAEITERYLGSRPIGIQQDVDILVQRPDSKAVERALADAGYRQARYDLHLDRLVDFSRREISAAERGHYELAEFARLETVALDGDEFTFVRRRNRRPIWATRGVGRLALFVDVHHALAADIDPGPLVERSIPSAFGVGATLCPADHLWLILSRFYQEVATHGERRLHPLAYAAALLAKEPIDWPVVVDAAREHRCRHALHTYLSFFRQLAGKPLVPDSVLDALRPARRGRAHEDHSQLRLLFGGGEEEPSGG